MLDPLPVMEFLLIFSRSLWKCQLDQAGNSFREQTLSHGKLREATYETVQKPLFHNSGIATYYWSSQRQMDIGMGGIQT